MQISVVKKLALFLSGVTLLCAAIFSCIIASQNALQNAPDTQMYLTIQAASHWLRDNHEALKNQVKNSTVTISAQMLVKQGYLPPDFLTHQQFQLNVTHDPQSFSQIAAVLLVKENNITRYIDPLNWPLPQTTAGIHYTKSPV